jgi:helix-turn-helix protein
MQHLDQKHLAERWLISPRTLEQWRWQGRGPRYLKIGGRVVYRLSDIEAFESARVHLNTIGPVDPDVEAEPANGDRRGNRESTGWTKSR